MTLVRFNGRRLVWLDNHRGGRNNEVKLLMQETQKTQKTGVWFFSFMLLAYTDTLLYLKIYVSMNFVLSVARDWESL